MDNFERLKAYIQFLKMDSWMDCFGGGWMDLYGWMQKPS
jgi:hypothetical protein